MTITKKEKQLIIRTIIITLGGSLILSGLIALESVTPATKVILGVLILIGGAFFSKLA